MKPIQTNRRAFMKKALLSTAALSMIDIPFAFSAGKRKYGIILNTVDEAMKSDYKATLKQLAELGYKYLEGGVYGDSPKAYAKFVKSIGLRVVAGGSAVADLQENFDKYIENANALKSEYIACYWPWLSSAEHLTREECLEAADRLNGLGKKVKQEGFRLTWHNHNKEFVDLNGKMPFDLLMENTDPDYVGVQMDLYWVRKGGQDPIDLIKKYPGRFDMYHVKDMDNTSERGITCVGEGGIDFKEIFKYDELSGVKYKIVENERATEGMHCATVSYHHLANL